MSSDIISFKQAAESRFSISTTEELRQYLTEAGEHFDPSASQDVLRRQCLRIVGLDEATKYSPSRAAPRLRERDDHIVPPYRLDANGRWGGRRIRILIPKPEGTKARAIGVSWNGKAPYWIPYDSVENVPIPHFEILKDCKRVTATTNPIPGTDGEMTTSWEFSDASVIIKGDDPLTKDLASSATEWYQWKGPEWFRKRNLRELTMIAAYLEISREIGPTGNRRMKTQEELLGDILLFLYQDADAQEQESPTKKD